VKKNIVLAFLTLLSLFVFWKAQSTSPKLIPTISFKKPQEYMKNLRVSRFTDAGSLKEKMSADEWAYLPEKAISTLKNPHLNTFKPDGTEWIVTAKKGNIKQPSLGALEEIFLEKTVVLRRPETKKVTPILIETEELNYNPGKAYAENDVFVTIQKPGFKITGIGLQAFLDKDILELKRDVKTYYGL
jgi:LPS export ABC transporter protein LptC